MLAQDKRHGPKRSLRLSYGVRRHHEWDPDSNSDVMRQKVEVSQWDNQGEIRNTILWVLKCVSQEGPNQHRIQLTLELLRAKVSSRQSIVRHSSPFIASPQKNGCGKRPRFCTPRRHVSTTFIDAVTVRTKVKHPDTRLF